MEKNNTIKTIEIKVKDFVGKYNKFSTASAKESYLKTAVKFVDYVDFETVMYLCDSILANSCMDKEGNIKVDTCQKYILYIFTIFDTYTNIKVDAKDWMAQFNMLSKAGLIEAVCQLMPENLITTLDSVLKMRTDDMMTNYYEPHAFIRNQVIKYVPLMHKVVDKVLEGIEKVVEVGKDVDWKKILNNSGGEKDGD